MKKWSQAAREGEAALRLGRPDHRVHFVLAKAYAALGDSERASLHAREAARLAEKR